MTLGKALAGVSRLAIDSSAFIDYAEAAPRAIKPLARIFERIGSGTLEGVTATLSLTEVLTHAAGDAAAGGQYEALLASVRLVPASEDIARTAALLRTRYRLATPDAIHLATALETGCQAFLTSDAGDFLRASGELRVIVPAKLTDT